jgi:hypothetical protein
MGGTEPMVERPGEQTMAIEELLGAASPRISYNHHICDRQVALASKVVVVPVGARRTKYACCP